MISSNGKMHKIKTKSKALQVDSHNDKRLPFISTSVSSNVDDEKQNNDGIRESKKIFPVCAISNIFIRRIVCDEMVFYCFDVLYCYLTKSAHCKTPKFTNEAHPLFVTWRSGSDKHLRGCIGTFSPTKLHNGLREYAIASATNDRRFNAITKSEFPLLHCAVSILKDFECARDYKDWDIGVHGIKIEFQSDNRKRNATFLPEVAVEQGWDHIKTVDSLLRKGGYKGKITPEFRQSISVTRYKSEKLSKSYSDFEIIRGILI